MNTCPECQVGLLKLKKSTYFTWLGSELISVPDFPTWICDVCGNNIYDESAVNRLNFLLSSNVGKPISSDNRPAQPRGNFPRPPQRRAK
jgi:YgiT-type zinc finger domain-containing protein